MKPSWHYFEAHVTIEPVFGERLKTLKAISEEHGFKVATLLMKKEAEDSSEPSRTDTFTTGRSASLKELTMNTQSLVKCLQSVGFQVWRYKIESTIVDSKYDDKFGRLGT